VSLYMVIENLRNGDALPVYRRFRDRGRMAPAGLSHVSSWVNESLDRCLPTNGNRRSLLDQRIAQWNDIVDFAAAEQVDQFRALNIPECARRYPGRLGKRTGRRLRPAGSQTSCWDDSRTNADAFLDRLYETIQMLTRGEAAEIFPLADTLSFTGSHRCHRNCPCPA
jgi:hypothetical protein